jgi:hypothetical protein
VRAHTDRSNKSGEAVARSKDAGANQGRRFAQKPVLASGDETQCL